MTSCWKWNPPEFGALKRPKPSSQTVTYRTFLKCRKLGIYIVWLYYIHLLILGWPDHTIRWWFWLQQYGLCWDELITAAASRTMTVYCITRVSTDARLLAQREARTVWRKSTGVHIENTRCLMGWWHFFICNIRKRKKANKWQKVWLKKDRQKCNEYLS